MTAKQFASDPLLVLRVLWHTCSTDLRVALGRRVRRCAERSICAAPDNTVSFELAIGAIGETALQVNMAKLVNGTGLPQDASPVCIFQEVREPPGKPASQGQPPSCHFPSWPS
jgi:hypothetical protein